MQFIKKNLSKLILVGLVVAFCITGYLYFFTSSSQKWGAVWGGTLTGLIIAIIEFLISLDERSKLDKIKALKVKNVLFDRANREYYEEFIKKATTGIDVMGVTAYRLLTDFAYTESSTPGKKILIQALMSNVRIRLLLPWKNHLTTQNDKDNFEEARNIMVAIHNNFPKHFLFRYYDHAPTHSIFRVDDECILGPVIPGISSKDTPAIHVWNSSKYAEIYLQYFENEWESAKEI